MVWSRVSNHEYVGAISLVDAIFLEPLELDPMISGCIPSTSSVVQDI